MARTGSITPLEPPVVRMQRLRPALGSWISIDAAATTAQGAAAAIEAAYSQVLEVARRLHPAGEGSDLTRISSAALGTTVPIDSMTWEVLQLAQAVHDASEGVFDPCLPCRPGRLSDLELAAAHESSKWARCRVPVALDLGGIAKGYAVDRAIETLRAAGCVSALVNAGGDLRTYGRRERILLRRADGNCVPVVLENEALAVSDTAVGALQRPPEHRGYYARARTARAVVTYDEAGEYGAAADYAAMPEYAAVREYAAVLAPCAALADALTKCVLLAEEGSAARALSTFAARRLS